MKGFNYVLVILVLMAGLVFPQPQWSPLGSPEGGKINVFLEKDGHYFVSIGEGYTFGAMYRSDDGGNTWKLKINGLAINYPARAMTKNNQYIFAIVYNSGVFRSSDYGENWEPCSNGIPSSAFGVQTIYNYSDGNSDILYHGSHNYGIFKSTDNGDTWTPFSSQAPEEYINELLKINDYLYAATSDGKFRSLNGENWEEVDDGIIAPYLKFIYCIDYFNGNMYAGLSDKVYRSSDFGETWFDVTNNVSGGYAFAINNGLLYKIGYSGIYHTTNGENWIPVQNNLFSGNYIPDILIDNNLLLAGVDMLFRSEDGGATWLSSTEGIANQRIDGLFIHNGYWFISGPEGLMRSSDNGITWETTYSLSTYAKQFYSFNNFLELIFFKIFLNFYWIICC